MAEMADDKEDRIFEELLAYLRRSRGFDFTGYKRSSLIRRVRKQMLVHQIAEFGEYLDYLQVHPEEFLPLFNTILINVTAFFRDTSAWKYLETQVLPQLIKDKPQLSPLRIWSAGCSSGEEAYTLAMVLAELVGIEQFRQRVKIYATDIDEDALCQARQATYDLHSLPSVPPEWRDRYFEPIEDRWILRPELRRGVIFGRHDLVQDAPISRLDLLVCRNTLMYFNTETQTKILDRFHFALNDTGILFLGKAEMLLTHANLFTPISLQHRIFHRILKHNRRERLLAFAQNTDDSISNGITHYVHLRESAFDTTPSAQLVVDRSGNLVLANAHARSLFGVNLLDRGRPLQDLEVSYRPIELRSLIDRTYEERTSITVANVAYPLPSKEVQYLDIQIVPIEDQEQEILGASIIFADMTRHHDLQTELQRTTKELETTNEALQSSNEELETTNEELQSTNEELETTNEELQSTNEELETMNEELQSNNEELQTINGELRQRTTDLDRANAFLNSILTSLQAGVVAINHQFNILSWNHEAEHLWGLRSEEVLGESLFALDIGLPVEQLREPIRNCLSGQTERQDLVFEAIDRRGKSMQCRISFNPLMSVDRSRQGVILLMEVIAS
jgi:two-component system, chemotaxis family, CheB/CheR fusion protein